MKNRKRFLLFIITAFTIVSCKKDEYIADFNNVVAPYVELNSKENLSALEGDTAVVAIRMRSAGNEDVIVNYSVSGAFNLTSSVIIPRNSTTANIDVPIPIGAFSSSGTNSAIVTLLSAKMGAKDLKIGLIDAALEKRTISVVENTIGLETSAISLNETLENDTIEVGLVIAKKLKTAATLAYTLTAIDGNVANSIEIIDSSPLVIPAGATSAIIKLKVNPNIVLNTDNKYKLLLTSVTGASGGPIYLDLEADSLHLTLLDDIKEVGFSSTQSSMDIMNAGNFNLEVKLSSPSSEAVTIPITITGGTANVDYKLNTGSTITIPPGATTANINLDVLTGYSVGTDVQISLTVDPANTDKEIALSSRSIFLMKLK